MSDTERNIHDPIIDTVEESDEENEEIVPTTPASERVEQADPIQDIGAYNGDSLVVTGSPFKKSYSGSSLGEASVDSLVDVPLPIESVALSPFRMDSIHHSPLPPRQKDTHTFSVSVSDSLPPHVMELDSPEHCGERSDQTEESEFCEDKGAPVKTPEEADKFFSGDPEESEEAEGASPPGTSTSSVPGNVEHSIAHPLRSTQPPRDPEGASDTATTTSEGGHSATYSQPLFESQASQGAAGSPIDPPAPQDTPTPQLSKPPKATPLKDLEGSCHLEEGGDLLLDEDILPPTDSRSQDSSKRPDSPTPHSPISAYAAAPKRKREAHDVEGGKEEEVIRKKIPNLIERAVIIATVGDKQEQEIEPKKSPKEDPSEKSVAMATERVVSSSRTPKKEISIAMATREEDTDSDIEILEDERSIEVLYDRGATHAAESQDLNLVLTEDTQGSQLLEDGAPPPPSSREEKGGRDSSNQSPSLLSMGDSDRLTCGDVWSPEEDLPPPQENTIRATQVELLCPRPPLNPRSPSGPNVESLIRLPIKEVHSPSTNGVAEEGTNTKEVTQESVREGSQPLHSPEEEMESQGEDASEEASVVPLVSYPNFDTPSQSQTTQEPSQSVFVRASLAAHERRRLEEEVGHRDPRSPQAAPHKDSSDEGMSNHSTPLGAIEPPSRSSQSTPISSHPEGALQDADAPHAQKLFYHISQERPSSGGVIGDRDSPHQKSAVYAEDSDEDEPKTEVPAKRQHKTGKLLPGVLTPCRRRGALYRDKKESTPVEGGTASSSPDLGSSLGGGQATINSSSEGRGDLTSSVESEPAGTDTAEVEDENVKCMRDLLDRGWMRVGTLAPIECWMSPVTRKFVLRIVGHEDRLLKPSELPSEVMALLEGARVERRISDVSSISRATSSSSGGYLADRSASSASSSDRTESTRLSIASVTTLPSPPRLPHTMGEISTSSSSSTSSASFRLPHPPPPLIPNVPKPTTTRDAQTQTEDFPTPEPRLSPSLAIEKVVPAAPRRAGRGRGRAGRPRGRPKGAQSREVEGRPVVKIPAPIEEEAEIEEALPPAHLEASPSEKDDFYALLPEDLREKLCTAQIPLTEDEEELFLLQETGGGGRTEAHWRQLEEVQRRVRVAAIEPHSLVFARYHDNNYYSAIVERRLEADRWEVHYNLDGCKHRVRELYVLPTELLPMGTRCYVRQPDQKFSDPGMVRGHVLSHRDEGHSPVLQHVMETHKGRVVRVPHSQIILSQNVAEALLESRRAFHSMIASPGGDVSLDNVVPGKLRRGRVPSGSPQKSRKADALLDSSEPDEGEAKRGPSKGKGTPRRTPQRVPTTISKETSESEDPPAVSPPPKSGRKRAIKTTSTSPQKTPRNARTLKTPTRSRSSRTPRAKRAFSEEASESETPTEGEAMNPVVELIQLDEKVVTPSKKRGRRPGSGTKSSRKAMKVEEVSVKEDSDQVDPLLGPLPPPGCQILKGYSILITHATNLTQRHPDQSYSDCYCAPLNKEYLKKQISGTNGHVVETFYDANLLHIQTLPQSKKVSNPGPAGTQLHELKELPADQSPSKVLCVSNSFCRTAKFIQCLTVGIPLVSSQWIVQSIMENAPVNWLHFLLPAGMSLLTGNLMEQTFKDNLQDTFSAVGRVVDVLQGQKVFLATSSNPDFGELWKHLLTAAKAMVHIMPPKAGNIQRVIDRRTTVVIADASIPEEELKRAREVGVPVVSSEWFIQSLIARCKLPYDAHPDFHYTHKVLSGKDMLEVVGADEEEEGDDAGMGDHITTLKR